jgi:hypothetical protein
MRLGSVVLAIVGALLLAGLVAMRCTLAGAKTPPPTTATPAASAPAAVAAAPAPARTPLAAPAQHPPIEGLPARTSAAAAPALLTVPSFTPVRTVKWPIADKGQLRQQTAAVEQELLACANQAASSGYIASGTAVLSFELSTKDGKVVVEATGADDDKTTIDNGAFVQCLADTAKAMQFAYVPDRQPVYALREVKFTQGKLTENKFIDFHYVR